MNIFEKLMVARQLSFTEGRIELMGQRVVFTPSEFFARYTLAVNEDPHAVYEIYNSAKYVMTEGFGVRLGKKYEFSVKDYSKWYIDLAKLSGWGIVQWETLDEQKGVGTISITDSPIATYLNGKVKSACDHIIRGLMAGGVSASFRQDLDIVETKCSALGAPRCEFVIDRLSVLKKKFPVLVKQQLGVK